MNRTRPLFLCAFLGLSPVMATADAASDLRVNQLEQEVRELKRQVLVLSRQIDDLQRARPDRGATRDANPATTTPSTAWVDAAKWQKLHTGMSELDVMTLLGPPSQVREADGSRLFFYALEIGSGTFLSGTVTLRDRVVAEIRKPELK
jgi:hypothetical protein